MFCFFLYVLFSFAPVNQNFCSETTSNHTHTAVSGLFLAVHSKTSVGAVQQRGEGMMGRGSRNVLNVTS